VHAVIYTIARQHCSAFSPGVGMVLDELRGLTQAALLAPHAGRSIAHVAFDLGSALVRESLWMRSHQSPDAELGFREEAGVSRPSAFVFRP